MELAKPRTRREVRFSAWMLEEFRHGGLPAFGFYDFASDGRPITAMILLAGQLRQDWFALAGLILVMGAVMLGCYLAFLSAGWLERLLTVQGEIVLSRLPGLLLAALAVQYVADGIKAVADPVALSHSADTESARHSGPVNR